MRQEPRRTIFIKPMGKMALRLKWTPFWAFCESVSYLAQVPYAPRHGSAYRHLPMAYRPAQGRWAQGACSWPNGQKKREKTLVRVSEHSASVYNKSGS
jgi:hypothetical protein